MSRLPAGTIVTNREYSLWEQSRGYVVAALALVLAQTALIGALLAQRIKRRTAEQQLRGSETELRRSYGRIRALGARLIHAQDNERARIARELHDDVSQQLALLSIDLDTMRRTDEPLRERALARAAAIGTSVHDLSHRLYPASLRLVGLMPALKRLQRDLAVARPAITMSFDNVPDSLPPDLTLCVFRIVQESLQNAIKHSRAQTVSVHLAGGDESLAVCITDDGVGFDVDEAMGKGLGLLSMRERLEPLGGTITVHSSPGKGTRLDVSLPVYLARAQAM
jgi:signal transduction histidine kinase